MQQNISAKWQSWSPQLLSVLRIVSAYIFIQSGTMKILGFPIAMPNGMQIDLLSQTGIGGMMELIGGALLLLGFYTRPVAFLLAGEMAVAYFQFHASKGFWTSINGGGSAMLFCFVFLYISAAGGGPWSIDALRKK